MAENGQEEEEVGGKGSLKAKDEEDEDEYVEEERDGKYAPFESAGMGVEVDDVDVGFGGQGIKKSEQFCGRWIERGIHG